MHLKVGRVITSKSGSFPNSSSNQLERSSADFLSSSGHTHNSRHAPTFVARLQSLTHGVHVANAFKSVVETAVGQFDQHFLQRLFVVFRIDEFGKTEFLSCKFQLLNLNWVVSVWNQPISNLEGLMSTPMIREAPASSQPRPTAKPTAPRPQTAQVLPFSTLAVFRAAP